MGEGKKESGIESNFCVIVSCQPGGGFKSAYMRRTSVHGPEKPETQMLETLEENLKRTVVSK